MKPVDKMLKKTNKLKQTNIVRPTVSQVYIIYEYRISRIGPKKHVQDQICQCGTFKSFNTLKHISKQNLRKLFVQQFSSSTFCKYLFGILRLTIMLRSIFVILALSKALERLNKQKILFIAGTLDSWSTFDLFVRFICSVYSLKDTMEQLRFIITKITKNFSQQYDCAMNNTRKISYFFQCVKRSVGRT